jgi:hypothetical protein
MLFPLMVMPSPGKQSDSWPYSGTPNKYCEISLQS